MGAVRPSDRAGVVAATLLVMGLTSGCTADRHPSTAASGSATTTTGREVVAAPPCEGLGTPEAAGAVTFVDGGRLLSVTPSSPPRCLLDGIGSGPALRWNGPADKLILPDGRVLTSGWPADVARGRPSSLTWSYPTGTAVLEVDQDGHLLRIPSRGGDPLDITFLAHHDAAIYHPAGTHVVSSGRSREGNYGLWVATNRGGDVRLLARGETANAISNLVFTVNHQLLFVADHGDHKDLHQLELTNERLVTVTKIPASDCFTSVVASRSPGGGVAWASGRCGGGPVTATAVRTGSLLPLTGTEMAAADPVGFLPDGTLVGRSDRGILTFSNGHVATIHPTGSTPLALRVVEPPSPPIELPGIPAAESQAPG